MTLRFIEEMVRWVAGTRHDAIPKSIANCLGARVFALFSTVEHTMYAEDSSSDDDFLNWLEKKRCVNHSNPTENEERRAA